MKQYILGLGLWLVIGMAFNLSLWTIIAIEIGLSLFIHSNAILKFIKRLRVQMESNIAEQPTFKRIPYGV